MSVFVKFLDVEVGVGGDEIEDVVLLFSEPVFPAYVPALYKKLVKTVGCGEINVAFHVLIVCPVFAMRLCLGIVESGEVEVLGVGVRPLAFA